MSEIKTIGDFAGLLTAISLVFGGCVLVCQKLIRRRLSHEARGDVLCAVIALFGLNDLANRRYAESQMDHQGIGQNHCPQNPDDKPVSENLVMILPPGGAR